MDKQPLQSKKNARLLSEGGSIRETTILQSVINAIPMPIFFKDAEGRYLGCNHEFENFVGRSIEEMVGKSVFELWDEELAQVYYDADSALYESGGKQVYEARVTYADGSVHDVIFHKAAFFAENEGTSGIVGAILDITDRKKAEEKLIKMAQTDALTGLVNRHILYTLFDGACKRALRNSKLLAVLALDLDGFKDVNDKHGHHFGDSILMEVATRLKCTTRQSDIVARHGGDEFIIVLEDIDEREQAARVSRAVVDRIAEPFILDGITVNISTSIGIAIYGSDGDDAKTLLKNADTALYGMKAAGKDGYYFFQEGS